MKALTIRDVDPTLAKALEREKRRRGTSLNQTVLELLRQATGAAGAGPYSNGLSRLAGTWSAEELDAFERAIAPLGEIDAELWS